ncbi:CaiB/BaiF CoA transferase family protein [Geminicoccus roseus]|uniref:CaiB/BaiF CoA transferase family protein n=1 Tax=Geminicoccus roseus TaxID=404900 RepID=UPI0004093914|nr:CaiB/BaiF CoA-transferase family protein [Geminicoccus roseus]
MLECMRVVSFCHYLQGPAASQYLADMGADVIKVEALRGAYERHWSGGNVYVEDVSGFFLCANRNKRVVALDLKSPAGLEAALRLVDRADAVIENFRPGVLDRLGLGYAVLRERRPDIIFASASGFGSSGPLRDKPGQDLLVQARTGLVAASGGGGTATGAAICDQHGGALLAMAVLGAYVRRLKTGKGTHVESSLFAAGIDLQGEAIVNFLTAQASSARFERDPHLATWFHPAPYGIYRTFEGRHLAISLNSPSKFAEALGDDQLRALVDIDTYRERDRYAQATAQALQKHRFEEVAAMLDAAEIWWAPVQDYQDLAQDPQARHLGIFAEVEVRGGKAVLVSHPIRYDGEIPKIRHLPLDIGQHTGEVLQELGYSPDEIADMARQGAIVGPGLVVGEAA